jgi:hypothetical protein
MGEVKLKRRDFLKIGGATCLSALFTPLNNLPFIGGLTLRYLILSAGTFSTFRLLL